jgi:hypothetical protein
METVWRAVPQIPFNNVLYQTGGDRKCPPTASSLMYYISTNKKVIYAFFLVS